MSCSEIVPLEMEEEEMEFYIMESESSEAPEPPFKSKWSQPEEPTILDPDHPLMKRFQESLRSHLERQIARIKEELYELENVIQNKQKERENLGVHLYDRQQGIGKQQTTLENYNAAITKMVQEREILENEIHQTKTEKREEMMKLNCAENKEAELRSELDSLIMLEHQFQDWQEEMESELALSQRITEKSKIDKKSLTEEKRKQDIFLYKLTSEVANLEAKLVTLDGQFRIKEVERETLSQTVADANADVDCLNREQHRLLQSWNGVVVTMHHKDKTYNDVSQELSIVEEKITAVKNEIVGLKRVSLKEMEKSEQLTGILTNLQYEINSLTFNYKKAEGKRDVVESTLSKNVLMLQETEKDIERTLQEFNQYDYQRSLLQREIEKLTLKKVEKEDLILQKLQSQIMEDKAAKHLAKMLQEKRDGNRQQELLLTASENQYAHLCLNIEQQNAANVSLETTLHEARNELSLQEEEVQALEGDMNQYTITVCQKQRIVDGLMKKLSVLIEKSGGQELSPTELKILDAEKTLVEIKQQCEGKKDLWLREQVHIVNLTQQRNNQLQEINLLRKQVLILDQKSLKIENDVERHKKETSDVNRSIKSLLNKLGVLNIQVNEKRGYKDSLDKENLLTQNEYIQLLQDAEMESLQLENEITDLEQEKVNLGEALLDAQREYLAWEKKFKMTAEAKQNIDKEKSATGELGAMKCEIHRMQVRYSQLCRAQEKLIQDLEQCVSRRDNIIDTAEGREKRSVKGAHNVRVNFQKKLEDMRNKIKQTLVETKNAEQLTLDAKQKQEELKEEISQKEAELKQMEKNIAEIEKQLEEGQLQKQQNLELLVRRQRKVRMYGDVKSGRHHLLYRTERATDAEVQKQKRIKGNLIAVVETLLTDFPFSQFYLKRILNTLHSQSA